MGKGKANKGDRVDAWKDVEARLEAISVAHDRCGSSILFDAAWAAAEAENVDWADFIDPGHCLTCPYYLGCLVSGRVH